MFFIVSICERAYYLQSPVLLIHIRFQKFAQKSIYNFFYEFCKTFCHFRLPNDTMSQLISQGAPQTQSRGSIDKQNQYNSKSHFIIMIN